MRRALMSVLGSVVVVGCFSGNTCLEVGCKQRESEPCEGSCVPFVGGAWNLVLVSSLPHCPEAAPFATMSSSSPPVTACGVQEEAGECGAGYVCLPFQPGWTACILRDGEHDCPDAYSESVEVPEVSLCCPSDEPPA